LGDGRSAGYDYAQEIENHLEADVKRAEVSGALGLTGRGADSFDIAVRDATMKTDGKEAPAPPFVVQGVRLNGGAERIESGDEWIVQIAYLLPGRALSPGETVEIPLRIPIKVGAERVKLDVAVKARLAGYVEREGKTLARIETMVDTSRLESATSPEFAFALSLRGVLLYDPVEQVASVCEFAASIEVASRPAGADVTTMRQEHFARIARDPARDSAFTQAAGSSPRR
jgi:hypothetical protein